LYYRVKHNSEKMLQFSINFNHIAVPKFYDNFANC